MLLATQNIIFGLSIFELAALLAGAAYVTSLVRDWRPMKALRQENRDLRRDLNVANDEIGELKVKVKELERATVPVLQREIVEVARILNRVVETLDHLDSSVKANTAAAELVASQSAIAAALDDHDTKG